MHRHRWSPNKLPLTARSLWRVSERSLAGAAFGCNQSVNQSVSQSVSRSVRQSLAVRYGSMCSGARTAIPAQYTAAKTPLPTHCSPQHRQHPVRGGILHLLPSQPGAQCLHQLCLSSMQARQRKSTGKTRSWLVSLLLRTAAPFIPPWIACSNLCQVLCPLTLCRRARHGCRLSTM